MFIGVCGNIVVIILTHTSKFWSKEKTETSHLVGNLALADLLMCLTLYPTWIVKFTLTILDIESDHLLFCKFSRSFASSLLFATVASLLAITVDRYIYIVKLLKYRLIVTRRRVFADISAIWLITCCIFALLNIELRPRRSICSLPNYIQHALQTFSTYTPVTAMILLNLQILLVSRKQQKRIFAETLRTPNSSINEDHQNKKTRTKLGVRFFVGIKEAGTFFIVIFCIFAPILLT